jgi:hypothetical protein
MKARCYSVYDRKTLSYHPPYYAPTDGAAVRALSDAMQDPNTTIGRHPADYVLYFVGEFDDQNGQLLPQHPCVHVVDLITLLPQSAQPPLFDQLAPADSNGKAAV